MNRPDSIFLSVCLAMIAFAAVYYITPPAPRYYPVEHIWRMGKTEGRPSMGWYGRSAWGVGAACLVGGLTALLTGAFRSRPELEETNDARRRLPDWSIYLLTAAALASLVLLAGQIVLEEVRHL